MNRSAAVPRDSTVETLPSVAASLQQGDPRNGEEALIVRELRQTLRTLRRSPGFATAVVLVLGLGIGANTAIYSVFDAVILRPLPYPAPERLVMLPGAHEPDDIGEEISPGNFLDWRRQSRSFAQIGVWAPGDVSTSCRTGAPSACGPLRSRRARSSPSARSRCTGAFSCPTRRPPTRAWRS